MSPLSLDEPQLSSAKTHVERLLVEGSEHEKNYQRARSWKTYWQSENIIPSKRHFDGKIKDTKALAVEAAKRYNLLPGVI